MRQNVNNDVILKSAYIKAIKTKRETTPLSKQFNWLLILVTPHKLFYILQFFSSFSFGEFSWGCQPVDSIV